MKKNILLILLGFPSLLQAEEKPLRILFVTGVFPLLAETFVINQITGLIDRGQDVTVYSFSRGNQDKVHPDVKKYDLLSRSYFGRNWPPNLASYDIIYCQFGLQGKELAEIKQRKGLKAKLVTCFRGFDLNKVIKKKPHDYDRLYQIGDLFLPVCDFFKERLIKNGCPPEKIKVHHSAIDCSRFEFKERVPSKHGGLHIVSVNRLVQKKGTLYVIQAIAKLLRKYPHIKYTIVGDGQLKRALNRLIIRLNIGHKVTLAGWAIQNEVIDVLKTAHIFVLGSLTASDGNEEGIPNALKEAMAMGIPVVSTYHSGIPELVESGVSGLLVPQKNSGAIARAIDYLILHPELWPEMGHAGRKKVEQEFDVSKEVDKLIEIFKGLIHE